MRDSEANSESGSSKTACPSCGANDSVPIVYGLPGPELMEEAKAGKVAIGGCIVTSDNPTRECTACGHRWRSSQEIKPGNE